MTDKQKNKKTIVVVYKDLEDSLKTAENFVTSFQQIIKYYCDKEDLERLYDFIVFVYYYIMNFYELLKLQLKTMYNNEKGEKPEDKNKEDDEYNIY